MKYDPRLRTWVEDDFDYEKNFRKQMDYINYKDLEKQLYPIDFKMHRDGKGANPQEHR
ncbi:hypothetical protein [Photorhabdus australis]|uniref:hypothetical protein n=1 Tax=Photorhabdus australis TaxID=286156 RepID=UPI000AB79980|nr:hypothetical protein [Photorhabdus australis]